MVVSIMTPDPSTRAALMPTGKLRAAINLGNPLLATKEPSTGQPVGVSIDLAQELCAWLAADLELVVFDAALKSVEAVSAEFADIGFFAVDPGRAASIAFAAPYVLIEGCYLVRNDSPLHSNQDIDRRGIRVTVGKGSAYDLFLSRELKHADLVRAPTSPTVVTKFLEDGLDVAAGVKQQLESDARKAAGLRLLPGHFMVIQQAIGVPISRGKAAIDYVSQFTEEMKRSGFVAKSLQCHGIVGASVAR